MAEIRKIVRANPLSGFQQAAPVGGMAFGLLADTANKAYDWLKPAAIERMTVSGDDAAREAARQTAGANVPAVPPAPGTTPAFPAPPAAAVPAPGAVPRTNWSSADMPPNPNLEFAQMPGGGDFGQVEQFYNLPAGYLGRTAWIESRGDPQAQNPSSSAGGLFQFIDSTARQYGLTNRFDAASATDAAARLAQDNAAHLRGVLGRDPTSAELYLAHQQGAGGAARLLRDPSADAASIVGADAVRLNGGRVGMTAGEFAGLWLDKFNGGSEAASLGFGLPPMQTGLVNPAIAGAFGPAVDLPFSLSTPAAPPAGRVSTSQAPPAAPMSSVPAPAAPPPPTMVRTASGALEARMFSPLSGEILQAHNAAARIGVLSEMMTRGQADLMDLSNQMPLNAEGFREASTAYIDQMVDGLSDDMLRPDLRAELGAEANRRYLGMVDEQHADVRQRADNSSSALIDRWSTNYVDSLAAGDAEGAATAQGQLEQLLYARESIPGLSWTREQSENVLFNAGREAERQREQLRDRQAAEWKDGLNLIIAARENGQTATNETLLDDPAVWEAQPELAAEAQAQIALQEGMPSFNRLTPDEQDATVRQMHDAPVSEAWQPGIVNAAARAAAASRTAWEDDPIARARDVLPDAPPAFPTLDPTNPQGFIDGLAARRSYVNGLVAEGYIDRPTFLSDAETESMSALLGPEVPAEGRLVVAGALASAFGEDAASIFDALETDDVTRFAGKLASRGGSMAVAGEAMRGAQMIDEGLVQLPALGDRASAFTPEIAAALQGLPADDVAIEAEVMAFANGIYAARSRGVDPSSEAAKTLMGEAVQAALGQTTDQRGRTLGGVQNINGLPVLLPTDVAGEEVQAALNTFSGRGLMTRAGDADRWLGTQPERIAAPGLPMVAGAALSPNLARNARLVPMGGAEYRMEIVRGSSVLDVADAAGNVFVVDLPRLVQAARTPALPPPVTPAAPEATPTPAPEPTEVNAPEVTPPAWVDEAVAAFQATVAEDGEGDMAAIADGMKRANEMPRGPERNAALAALRRAMLAVPE